MDLEVERRGAVQILTINRPEARNAMSPAVIAGIGRGMAEADADPGIRVVVLTGTGDRAFCSGMDLKGFAAGAARSAGSEADIASFQRFIRDGISTPVVGAANGTAVAGGLELLLACDLVVAAEGARFGLPEVKRGLVPAGGGVFLSRRIPLAVAYELTLTGDMIGHERAMALGLVNRVVPAPEVLSSALALAEAVAANGPLAVAVTKRLVRAASAEPPATVWALQDEVAPAVFSSDDAQEGARAFIERRPPVWTGR